MNFLKSLVGMNTVHTDMRSAKELGIERMELCMGRVTDMGVRMSELSSDIISLGRSDTKYTIHHPMFIYDYFEYDYLDSFFLDSDPDKRRASFSLLRDNLKEIRRLIAENNLENAPEYIVIHFPGVYPEPYMLDGDFDDILEEALAGIESAALEYDFKIAFEYFGSNSMFYDVDEWIKRICSRNNLYLLTDTGHLYFASIMRSFDFDEAFEKLIRNSLGAHIWTCKKSDASHDDMDEIIRDYSKLRPVYEIKGEKDIYGANEFYRKYHHIIVSYDQKKSDGWAFDGDYVVDTVLRNEKPFIIEASPIYGGNEYYLNAIKSVVKRAEEFKDDSEKR
jgi:endonuclease IV